MNFPISGLLSVTLHVVFFHILIQLSVSEEPDMNIFNNLVLHCLRISHKMNTRHIKFKQILD